MPSYIPEHVYGFTGWDDVCRPTYGLVPWPDHLKPREAPCKEPKLAIMSDLPALAEADGVFFITLARGDRLSIATTIERLIDMLDAIDGDPDLEPYLAGQHMGDHMIDLEGDDGYGGDCDREPWLGWTAIGHIGKEQPPMFGPDLEDDSSDYEASLGWGSGYQGHLHADRHDEAEEENEHGGDIQDEPHDEDTDREPFLGWGETCGQGPKIGTGLRHDPTVQCLDDAADPHDHGGGCQFDGKGYHEANEMLRAKGFHPVRVTPGWGW